LITANAVSRPLKAVARRAGLRRADVAAVRVTWERGLISALPRRDRPAAGRILCYHGVGTPGWGINDLSPSLFRDQLDLAAAWGHRFVPAARIAAGEGRAGDLAITFDDGLMSLATQAAPILAERGIPWTVFVVTDWAEGRHGFGEAIFMGWSEIERLAATGVELGSHSVSHARFGSLPAEEARYELAESRRVIELRTGIHVRAFAIPMGQSKDWSEHAQAAAEAVGYEHVYAQSYEPRPRGTVPRTFIARSDNPRVFKRALEGAFDHWEERV
jgi:peptidoglycan/xylan/chitin deacetylase (PgdA/CDA1 family)